LAGLCNPSSALALLAGTGSPLVSAAPTPLEFPVPNVEWDNEMSDEYTVLHLEAADRVGLLYRVFRLLAENDLNVAQAVITTDNGRAGDVFFVTEANGAKLLDAARRERVSAELRSALEA
jgi:[protein-PII] uridylyltransferase